MAYTVKAELREDTGKGKVKKLRRKGRTPAVMYGHGDPSLMLQLDTHRFTLLLDDIRGHSAIVDLELDGKPTKCVIKTLQRNPVDGSLIHVDFQKVHPDEKITLPVPVILHGSAAGVKEGGMLDHLLREVPVRATLDKIPEHFDINVDNLGLGESVHISELGIKDLEFAIPETSAVVTVLVPRKLAAAQAEKAEKAAAAEAAAAAPAGEEPKEGEETKTGEEAKPKPEEAKK